MIHRPELPSPVPSIASTFLVFVALAACGGSDDASDGTAIVGGTSSTSPAVSTEPATTEPPTTTDVTGSTAGRTDPTTTLDTPDPTVDGPDPETSDGRTASTPSTAPEASAPPTTAAPPPPLVGTTDLLVDGVTPLPDAVAFATPTIDAGRHHSYRLGTELVLDIPEPIGLYRHLAGTVAFDVDADRVLVISRWGDDEPLGPDEWTDALVASGWEITEADAPDIGGNAVRRFDVVPTSGGQLIGGVALQDALFFGDGLPRRIWIIDQPDGRPIVIGTGIPDDRWGDLVAAVVDSVELGPPADDPRAGRAPLEYGSLFWSAEAGVPYRTLMFGDAVVDLPVDVGGLQLGQLLSIDVPGEYTGTTRPLVHIGAVGEVIDPPDDPAAPAEASTLGRRPASGDELVEFMSSLAERELISELRPVDVSTTLLGSTTSAVEFDVPSGAELPMFFPELNGWSQSGPHSLTPATTYRLWAPEVGDQVAVVLVQVDTGNADDLARATDFAAELTAAFGRS